MAENEINAGQHESDASTMPPETMPPETMPPETMPPETVPGESTPPYTDDKTTAYLAYILRETELIRMKTERIRRNTSAIIALLALAIIVLIIVWLDITGTIPIF